MTISRGKIRIFFSLLVVLAVPAMAQMAAETGGRDASFLPPASAPASAAPPTPVPLVPVPAAASVPVAKPVDLGKPVETGMLGNIDPESIGLWSPAQGGLGAAMWKGTSRIYIEQLLSILNLPTASPALNSLAQRLLLTAAVAPEGVSEGSRSLVAPRAEKLLALGDAQDAWKLVQLAKPEQTDEITLRMVAEAALLSPERDDVCAKLPEIVKTRTSPEWQKLLLVCQLRAKDMKAAQLTLDLLHTQGVRDDSFFFIAEKNVIGGGKQLPRQLTPLKPLTLALLRMLDLPLPGEVFMHPDAALVPELLQTKAREESLRMGLAERAASRGFLSAADLGAAYRSVVFPPESLATAANSPESGARLHALLYQAALQEKLPQNRINDVIKFMQTSDPALLNGAGAQILAEMIGDIPPGADYNASSGLVAHIYMLANKPNAALEWLKLARGASVGMPPVTMELQNIWPLEVVAGLESEGDYKQNLGTWLDAAMKPADPKADNRAQRDQAASILLLLDATGFAVPEDIWAKVITAPVSEKHAVPPALLFERMRASAAAVRRGETVLLAVAMAGSTTDNFLLITVETVRALRLVGLTADAAALAREAAMVILTPKP